MFNTCILYKRTASYTTVCLNNNIKNYKITKTAFALNFAGCDQHLLRRQDGQQKRRIDGQRR
jgi:hypothetical protein